MAATDVEMTRLPTAVELRRPARSLWKDAWHQFTRHRLAMAGLITFFVLVVATLIGPIVYQASISTIDFTQSLKGPSAAHTFGTDDLGRKML
ncbi:MAG TPA: ABC transporter permease, partial [Candidatus Limnocylindria bacterium]|nr:ABC transporter permease [Candidatus Limnocylindria bacterium]